MYSGCDGDLIGVDSNLSTHLSDYYYYPTKKIAESNITTGQQQLLRQEICPGIWRREEDPEEDGNNIIVCDRDSPSAV